MRFPKLSAFPDVVVPGRSPAPLLAGPTFPQPWPMPRQSPAPHTDIIVVSGLPRSGTSLMMNMLQAGGVDLLTDDLRGPDLDNPLGYFEFDRVRSLAKDSAWIETARGKAIKVISPLIQHLPAKFRYQIVFMRRDLDEVIASQARMLEHRGMFHDPAGDDALRAEFVAHLSQIESLLRGSPFFQVHDVSYSALVRSSALEVDRLSLFLGRDLNVAAMSACVDPALYRNRGTSQITEVL